MCDSCAGIPDKQTVFENFRNGLATCDVFDRVLEVHVFSSVDTSPLQHDP
jgi:hypothetical protein